MSTGSPSSTRESTKAERKKIGILAEAGMVRGAPPAQSVQVREHEVDQEKRRLPLAATAKAPLESTTSRIFVLRHETLQKRGEPCLIVHDQNFLRSRGGGLQLPDGSARLSWGAARFREVGLDELSFRLGKPTASGSTSSIPPNIAYPEALHRGFAMFLSSFPRWQWRINGAGPEADLRSETQPAAGVYQWCARGNSAAMLQIEPLAGPVSYFQSEITRTR